MAFPVRHIFDLDGRHFGNKREHLRTKFTGTRNSSRKGEIRKTPRLNGPDSSGIQQGKRRMGDSILRDFLDADNNPQITQICADLNHEITKV